MINSNLLCRAFLLVLLTMGNSLAFAQPTPITPIGGSSVSTTTPTFTWSAEPGTIQYVIQAHDSTGTQIFYVAVKADQAGCAQAGATTCSYTRTDLPFANGAATWLIRTDSPVSGPNSAVASFNVGTGITPPPSNAQPTPVSPIGGSSVSTSTPTFTWTAKSGTIQYVIQAHDSTGTEIFYVAVGADQAGCAQAGATTCSYTRTDRPFANGAATWLIRTDSPVSGPNSAVASFNVGTSSSCNTLLDSDGDRLPDCYETNTKKYVSAQNTGTSPINADTDGDGLRDGDEVLGTINGLMLQNMGVSPLRKNILIEYDWFDDSSPSSDKVPCSFHSHKPTSAVINRVAGAFNKAPVTNPDGTTGITIIQDYGQGGVFNGGSLIPTQNSNIIGGFDTDFYNYKAFNFSPERSGYFHYIIMSHYYTLGGLGSSGYAETPGDDVIISTGCGLRQFNNYTSTENLNAIANTIMHELGHNLGLNHGGNITTNFKPNYNSVMNYNFQFLGVDSDNTCNTTPDEIIDYSDGNRNTLNENSINESIGVCNNIPIDFNRDGVISTNVAVNINGDGIYSSTGIGPLETLVDHNDWANLNLLGINDSSGFSMNAVKSTVACQKPAYLN